MYVHGSVHSAELRAELELGKGRTRRLNTNHHHVIRHMSLGEEL